MDPSQPLNKIFPFKSFKTRQWLLFWTVQTGKLFDVFVMFSESVVAF